jgi:hypothetical protein
MSPLLGAGYIPGGAIGTELSVLTRRAFVPTMPVQIYQATPTLSMMIANAQTASGGVSSVTVPIQGTAFVNASAVDYSGAFPPPAVLQGAFETDWNLALVVVPIPFLGTEGLAQLDAAVIPLLEARMNDAGNAAADYLSTQLTSNATTGTLNIDGFPLIGGNAGLYGNLSRTTNAFWQANVKSAGSVAPTRANVLQYVLSAGKFNGGELPTFGMMPMNVWGSLAQDFLGLERYVITPDKTFDETAEGARAAFSALMVGTVPIYCDPYFDANMSGQLLLANARYLGFYIHESAAFAFTGFASTLPNFQLGWVGAVIVLIQTVCVKSKSVTLVSNFTGLTL